MLRLNFVEQHLILLKAETIWIGLCFKSEAVAHFYDALIPIIEHWNLDNVCRLQMYQSV